MVWDRIHARDGRGQPVEEWGGIAYALAAAAAALPRDWQVVPIVKLGADLQEEGLRFMRALPRLDAERGVRVVPEPNNRVELRYVDRERRCERLSGGVQPWRWEELWPIVEGLDALYINFISGFELDLEAAQRLRAAYHGPIYADLHSIFLGLDAQGNRVPRPLTSWPEWLRCFDAVQMNEEELGILASAWGDPWRLAASVVGDELRLLLVTLGERGSAYVASPAFRPEPLDWRSRGLGVPRPLATPGAARSERILVTGAPLDGDPTGCGDVFGATCFSALLNGAGLEDAMRAANEAAGRNVVHRGATGLFDHLQGRIGT
jgi:sugar/nucleoside kinase (ribokinase family)